MKSVIFVAAILATNACMGACLPPLFNPLLAGPLVNNVIAPTATLIPPAVLGAILPPALAPVVPLLNAVFPQGCPAPVVNAILTANLPAAAGIATNAGIGNGIGLPASLSLLSAGPSVNVPFGLTAPNLIL